MLSTIKKQNITAFSISNLRKLSEIKKKMNSAYKSLYPKNLVSLSKGGKIIKIHFDKNYKYEGEINKNYIPNGDGNLYYPNGDYYFGEFVNGKKEGIGEYHYKDGTIYIGNWLNDLKQGEGCIINPQDKWKFNGIFSKDNFIDGKFSFFDSCNYYNNLLLKESFLKHRFSNAKFNSNNKSINKSNSFDNDYQLDESLNSINKKLIF